MPRCNPRDAGSGHPPGKRLARGVRDLFHRARADRHAFDQLRTLTEPHGYRVIPMVPTGCLHLKSACTYLGRGMVLANPAWIDVSCVKGADIVPVAGEEPFAANALSMAGRLV